MNNRDNNRTTSRRERLGMAALFFMALVIAGVASLLTTPPRAEHARAPEPQRVIPRVGVVSIDYGDDGSIDAEVNVPVESLRPSARRATAPNTASCGKAEG